jgi:hypothetical protein
MICVAVSSAKTDRLKARNLLGKGWHSQCRAAKSMQVALIAFSRALGLGNVPLFLLLRPIFHGEHRCFLREVGAQSKDELRFIGGEVSRG